MIVINKKSWIGLAIVCAMGLQIRAVPPTNFSFAQDADYRMGSFHKEHSYRLGMQVEYGATSKSRDLHENKAPLLSIYGPYQIGANPSQSYQSAINFLKGAEYGSPADLLLKSLGMPAVDDYRGNFALTGRYSQSVATVFGSYILPIPVLGRWSVSLYLPVVHASLSNLTWTDLTESNLPVDQRVKDLLTSKINSIAADQGGLNLNSWKRTGVGDLVMMFGWDHEFKQNRELLRSTTLKARLGAIMPTGGKNNQNKTLCLPFGSDGAWGIPFEFGLDLNFVRDIVVGGQIDYVCLFASQDRSRLKTDYSQTDFLVRDNDLVKKVHGATWRFMLHAGAEKIVGGLFADMQYQFTKHDDDRLYPLKDLYNTNVINSLQSIQHWAVHTATARLGYDFTNNQDEPRCGSRLSFFYKLPLGGRRAVMPHIFGGQFSLSF
jgi:hypothetical protein